jgi:hypothetical protein
LLNNLVKVWWSKKFHSKANLLNQTKMLSCLSISNRYWKVIVLDPLVSGISLHCYQASNKNQVLTRLAQSLNA